MSDLEFIFWPDVQNLLTVPNLLQILTLDITVRVNRA
jgi:hypothetical protein